MQHEPAHVTTAPGTAAPAGITLLVHLAQELELPLDSRCPPNMSGLRSATCGGRPKAVIPFGQPVLNPC